MKNFKNLAVVGISKEQQTFFKKVCDTHTIVDSCSFVDYVVDIADNCDIVLYAPVGVDTTQMKQDFQLLRGKLPKVPVIMGLHEKNFDVLLQAFYYNIKTVLLAPFDELDFKQALIKCSILQVGVEKLPTKELLTLFSRPIKNSNIQSVYNRLKEYLQLFENAISFSVYSYDQSKVSLLFGHEAETEKKVLGHCQEALSEQVSVGQYKIYAGKKVCNVYFPLYQEQDSSIWAVVNTKTPEVDYIFNNYFLNYIEGTSHYHHSMRRMDDLVKLANTDEVTGLYNQRKLSEDLENTIISHEKNHEKFSIMFIDVDHFKVVNDKFGHIVGSDILCQMGNAIKATLRGSDYVYRYGGDEFVVIMPNVEINTVHTIAVRVFDTIKSLEFNIDANTTHKVTVSIGISEYPTDAKSAKEIIQFADEMMYQSKKSGRGKIFHVSEIKK